MEKAPIEAALREIEPVQGEIGRKQHAVERAVRRGRDELLCESVMAVFSRHPSARIRPPSPERASHRRTVSIRLGGTVG